MDRQWKASAAGAPPPLDNASAGYPQSGNPGAGVAPTKPGPHWYHMVTEELLAAIADAGIAFDKTSVTQVRDAIRKMYMGGGQGRLSKSGANLLLAPVNGNRLVINGKIEIIPDAGITLAPPAVASTTYYIYAYMNAGVMTLEQSATVPAVQAGTGVSIKTGDATRSLVGMARTTAGNAWADTAAQRFVRSWFNDGGFAGKNSFTADRSTTSTSYVELNTEIRVEFLTWSGEVLSGHITGTNASDTSGQHVATALAFDGAASEPGFESALYEITANNFSTIGIGGAKSDLGEGYHYATLIGRVNANTGTWSSSSGTSVSKVYLHVATSGH